MTTVISLQWGTNGIDDPDLLRLRAGDAVEITGRVITLRDASAGRLARAIGAGEPLPCPLDRQLFYAVGPSPAKPGQVIGSASPTTTARMGKYLPALFSAGARGVIGKGELHGDAAAAFAQHRAVYFAAVGGIGALLARQVTSSSVIAYEELGPEALYALEVTAFPAVVIIDTEGRNFHEIARQTWRR